MSNHHQQEIKITTGCPAGTIPMLQRTNAYSNNVQIILLSILLSAMVLYFIYAKFLVGSSDTLFVRYKDFFTRAYGNITITFIIGLLAWTLVSEFVTDIIQPLVEASVPDYNSWYSNVVLKTYYQTNDNGQPETVNVLMKPGPFLITLISFIISVIIVFIFAEIIYKISEIPFISFITKYIAYITVFGLVTFFLVWSVIDKNTINEATVCSVPLSGNALRQNNNRQTNQQTNQQMLETTATAFANSISPSISPSTFLTQIPTREQRSAMTNEPIIYTPNVI